MKTTKKTLEELERVAKLLDNQFQIGPFKFGIDPLIGLIPGIGDFIPLLFSVYLIVVARREKLDAYITHQMIGNMLIDFIIGSVPVVGDVGDFFFKASERNLAILRRELRKKDKIPRDSVEEGVVL